MNTRHTTFLLLLALVFLAVSAPVMANEVQFGTVEVVEEKLRVNFFITSYQAQDIVEAIKRGIEVKIVYEIQLYRPASFFLLGNKVDFDKIIRRSVKYDFWAKAFVVMEGRKTVSFQSENAMLEHFFSVRDYDMVDMGLLKGQGYAIRARAELKSVELYFPMSLIFKYMVGFWNFDTGWENGPRLEF
jgi:hypothetical protein